MEGEVLTLLALFVVLMVARLVCSALEVVLSAYLTLVRWLMLILFTIACILNAVFFTAVVHLDVPGISQEYASIVRLAVGQWFVWAIIGAMLGAAYATLYFSRLTVQMADRHLAMCAKCVHDKLYRVLSTHYVVLFLWATMGWCGCFREYPWLDKLLWTTYAVMCA
jgi:hypothetical protein